MREAITEYVAREEKREAFGRRALPPGRTMRRRLHLTEREADAWMARLEAGQDVEPPECHD